MEHSTKESRGNMLESEKLQSDFLTLGDPELIRMKAAAEKFFCDVVRGEKPYWISFLGTSGAGKTMLAKEIFRAVWNGPRKFVHPVNKANLVRSCQWVSWRKASQEFLSGNFEISWDMCDDWFVALDDIGANYDTAKGLVNSKLGDIVDARIGKWTIVTCNLSLQQISDQMDARISSRMIRGGSVVIDVELPDFNARRNS